MTFRHAASARLGIVRFAIAGLLLGATAARAQSTWDGGGGDNNWGTAANWSNNAVPVFPADLTFAGSTRLAPNNNLGNVAAKSITFDGTAGAFTLGGNAFTLGDEATADYRSGGISQLGGDTQTINNNLTFSRGQHHISTAGTGGLTLNGTITRSSGASVRFEPTSVAGGAIKTTLTNTNGLLGGWATIRNPNPAIPQETFMFAKVDAMGNVVPYLDYTAADDINGFGDPGMGIPPETTFPAGMNSSSNIRWYGTPDLPGLLTAPAGISDLNTFLYEQDTSNTGNIATAYQEVAIGDGNTLRFSSGGGIFRSNPVGAQEWESLRFSGGTITAGHSSALAELYIWTSTTQDPAEAGQGEHHNDTINFQSTNITDNPDGGAVRVIKSGPGAVRTNAADHSFTGGLYLNRGVWRAQSNMSVAFGAGDVHVASGAQAYVNADGEVPNRFYLSGTGINEGTFHVGAMRVAADGAVLNGDLVLTSDARFGNRGAQAPNTDLGNAAAQGVLVNGKITGDFNLELSVKNDQGAATLEGNMPTIILNNSANDWSGNTTIGRGRVRVGGLNDTNEVIPHGPGKGNLTLLGETVGPTVLTLDSHTETVNGLSSDGDASLTFITNQTNGEAHLRVGANDASSTFAGTITDFTGLDGSGMPINGKVRLTKIGAGMLTLTGTNAYGGDTRVEGGVLSVQGPNLADMADVYLSGSGKLDLNFAGMDTIDSLFFNGAGQATGTWGSPTSTATNKNAFFTGNGILNVSTVGMGSIPGDFDGDGDVDANDLNDPTLGWKARFGAAVNGLDGNDFLVWQRNLGTPAVAAAGAVPEPTAWTLLALAALGAVAARRRQG